MNYDEALEWIHGKLRFGIKPGIERMKWMLNELGNPHEKLVAIHVVGTNGKGSTTAYLQSIFSLAGYEVGTFTSPYLIDFRERISLNGQMIAKTDFLDLVNRVSPIVERLPLETDLEAATEFEVITVLMFAYFGWIHPVDIAIIEAGMGGLYDSTNVFKALAVVCPSIGLDHQSVLGETYTAIATQKVGVLKEGVPLIYATDREDVRAVFQERAKQLSSPLYEFRKDFSVSHRKESFDFQGTIAIPTISIKMLGDHQVTNASLAIETALLLRETYPRVTIPLIREGLSKTNWLARTELIFDNVMIDGAHNRESVQALVAVMQAYQHKKVHILFAAIDTKPVDEMLALLETVGEVQVTEFIYPNALPLSQYPERYQRVTSWQEWLSEIDYESETDFYLITGSLYFMSQVRPLIIAKKEELKYKDGNKDD